MEQPAPTQTCLWASAALPAMEWTQEHGPTKNLYLTAKILVAPIDHLKLWSLQLPPVLYIKTCALRILW